jgi:1D-myo-inositol 3-kinase
VPRHDYTTVGHVTVDVLPDGSRQPGGTAFYSALQAARLGLRTLILTQGDRREIEELLAPYRGELELRVTPAPHTTTLRTEGTGHERRQQLLAWAGQIAPPEVDTAILHLAPVARETPRTWRGAAAFVGLTPQGLIRTWAAAGEIELERLRGELLPERSDAWVLNKREHARCAAELHRATADGIAVVAVTDGAHPIVLNMPHGEPQHIPVPSIAIPADDLGAGDVFAAAFFVALHEGHPSARAVTFATAAAGVRIASAGPAAIGDRRMVERRWDVGQSDW